MSKLLLLVFAVVVTFWFSDNKISNGSDENSETLTPANLIQSDTVVKTCLDCHASMIEEEEIHSPARKKCVRCHVSNGEEHPLDKVIGFALASEVPGLCYECHDPKNEETYVHEPAGEGKCLLCHSPHSSPNLYLVKASPVSSICLSCHELHVPEGNMVHQAVTDGECQVCHNPHQSENEKFLPSRQARLCRSCHKEIRKALKLDHVHPPFKNECLSCHKGHSSKEAHLSDLKTKDLCISCHEDMHNTIQNASLVHQAINVDKSCLNCHSPHSSTEEKILLADSKTLCLDCHNKEMTGESGTTRNIAEMLTEGNTIHGAIETEGCSFCHEAHASDRHTLLTSPFPAERYAPAETDNFELCFRCHDKELFAESLTTTATNFRNGDQNLHYVHINGIKGRNCNLCHNVHGASNDHLIDEKVEFGNWEMPVNYVQHKDGGSCAPGCHEERRYERIVLLDSLGMKEVQADTTELKTKPDN